MSDDPAGGPNKFAHFSEVVKARKNSMVYKGYIARIEYSNDDRCFIGHIAGIDDVVGFHGKSVAELRAAFEEAVDDYVQTCEKLDRLP